MKVHLAKTNDVPEIVRINQSVNVGSITSEAKGFLIYRYDASNLTPLVERNFVFLAEQSGEALGYLVFKPWRDESMQETREEMAMVNDATVDLSAVEKLIWISQIGVAFSAGRRGVGRALYAALFEKFPGHSFGATIAEIPHNNEASMALHTKLGFSRIGSFETDDFHGVKNYRSGVYFKR